MTLVKKHAYDADFKWKTVRHS